MRAGRARNIKKTSESIRGESARFEHCAQTWLGHETASGVGRDGAGRSCEGRNKTRVSRTVVIFLTPLWPLSDLYYNGNNKLHDVQGLKYIIENMLEVWSTTLRCMQRCLLSSTFLLLTPALNTLLPLPLLRSDGQCNSGRIQACLLRLILFPLHTLVQHSGKLDVLQVFSLLCARLAELNPQTSSPLSSFMCCDKGQHEYPALFGSTYQFVL
jgi:hypothetical protein